MLDQLILKFITLFSQCDQECNAKDIVRANMENFDEEQKIQYVHNVCHLYGGACLLFKICAVALIFQIIFFSFFFRLR